MKRSQVAGLLLLSLIALAAIAAPVLATNPPSRQHADLAYAPPMRPRVLHNGGLRPPFVYPLQLADRLERRFTAAEDDPMTLRFFAGGRVVSTDGRVPWLPIGADPLGRDVFARLLTGARLSLGVAAVAVVITLMIGVAAGAIAGYSGGLTDRIVSTIADFVVVLPVLYAVVTLRAALPLVLDPAQIFWTIVFVLAFASWPLPARGVRAIVAVERQKAYAEAAYAAGGGPLRILLRHILPAAGGHIAMQGLLLFPAFIFAEATLSYIGLGFADTSSSWGVMLQDASRVSAMTEAPWLLSPAVAIVATVFAVHLVISDRAALPTR